MCRVYREKIVKQTYFTCIAKRKISRKRVSLGHYFRENGARIAFGVKG